MSHVLLIRPLCADGGLEFAEPLGIERLAGYLHATNAARVTVMDRRLYQQEQQAGVLLGRFWDDLRQACEDDSPSMVGLSLMTSADVPDALRIISRMRALYPAAHLVAGGLYVTTNSREAKVRLPKVVTLLTGEGELSLRALVCKEAAPQRTLDPDEWAMAYRPHLERYASLGCAVNMQTSRGCPGSCTFCATPGLGEELRRWRPRGIELVADEIELEAKRLEQAGLPAVFNFVDDDFGPLVRVEALAEELKRRQLRVAFALEMRLAALTGQPNLAERMSRLHEAGLTRVFFGIETLNPQTLRQWHKSYDMDGLPEVVLACRAAGVTVQAGYILWHANQTLAGARSEVEGMARLNLYSHRLAQSRLIVFPGCALGDENPGAYGFQRMDRQCEAFYQRFCERTAGLAQEWLEAAVAEPYATAEAFLTGDAARVDRIRQTLQRVNEQSLAVFRELSDEVLGGSREVAL